MKIIYSITIAVLMVSCAQNEQKPTTGQPEENIQTPSKEQQTIIIKEHISKASQYNLYSRERQEEIDKGLAKDSTIAYLWQQKAMPLYKQGKYDLGLKYINQAVKFDTKNEWQEYRAFMTCIFAKRYEDAIKDFEDCKLKFGNSFVMDHSYDFYIAISKIQLNQFDQAEKLLLNEINEQVNNEGEDMVHHLNLFYLGISRFEQRKYQDAISVFDRALAKYPRFSEAVLYKSKCEAKLGNEELSYELQIEARKFGKQGHTINEDNSIYERYPYQERWEFWE